MFSKLYPGMLMAAALVATTGCGSPLEPSCFILCDKGPPYRVSGEVGDDSQDLPDGAGRVSLEGVRIEIIEGAEKGRFAISGPTGFFDLDTITSNATLRATKEGWGSRETCVCSSFSTRLFFSLSQAPHTLWGYVVFPGGPTEQVRAPGVRVEIIDGPNAGKVSVTESNGLYRFDDLATQPTFQIEFSKADYRTDRAQVVALDRNRQLPWRLTLK